VRYLVSSPAMDRLGWILDGLNGAESWGADAHDVLAPEFAALVPPDTFTERVRQRAAAFAPATVIGLDTTDHTARARVRVRDGSVQVVTCTVEPAAPHRIKATTTIALIPSSLTPRLPADFTGYQELAGRGAGARLIVFSGLPGTGKSTLAEAAGRELRVPVFAVDWLLGSLTPFGGYHWDDGFKIGEELLTTLAFRQLALGQSAILDFPAEDLATRIRWRTLARAAGADFLVVVCACSDRQLHRARLEGRQRGIPGWHEGGNWANVDRRLAEFPPWTGEVLTIDAVQPPAQNLATVLKYVTDCAATRLSPAAPPDGRE
jgi:predicted kinase